MLCYALKTAWCNQVEAQVAQSALLLFSIKWYGRKSFVSFMIIILLYFFLVLSLILPSPSQLLFPSLNCTHYSKRLQKNNSNIARAKAIVGIIHALN